MSSETPTSPEPAAKPAWQRYLPAGAAATVAVAAVIGIQAASSSGAEDAGQRQGPGPMSSQVPGQAGAAPPSSSGQSGQTPPWGQDGGAGGQVPPGAGAGQVPQDGSATQAPPWDQQDDTTGGAAVPDQGMASPRTGVS